MHWEDYLFEVQNAVEWRAVMSRGPDERTQMHSMSYPLSTMSNRELIDDGAAWVLRSCRAPSNSSEIEQLVRNISSACWPRQPQVVQRSS